MTAIQTMGRPKLIGPLTASETKKKQQRKESYERNKPLTKRRALESKRNTQRWFKEEKQKYQCSHCGSKVYDKLGFYDLTLSSTRLEQVSEIVGRKSRDTIKKEMESRTCLCENCWHTHYRHY